MEKQFRSMEKCIRTNNARELSEGEAHKFYIKSGIRHETRHSTIEWSCVKES